MREKQSRAYAESQRFRYLLQPLVPEQVGRHTAFAMRMLLVLKVNPAHQLIMYSIKLFAERYEFVNSNVENGGVFF